MQYAPFILISITNILFNSCDYSSNSTEVPEEFKNYIYSISDTVDYKEILPFHGKDKKEIPAYISKNEAIEDIQIFEYLLNTSYSGFEYGEFNGVNFKTYFTNLRDFINEKDTLYVNEFEGEISKILEQINDGHIAIVGSKYNWAYKHKSIYYCDILVEKTNDSLFKVIDSQLDIVKIGDLFTQIDAEKYLFRTLSPPDKRHYLVGAQSYAAVTSRQLSFNNKIIQVPHHKSRLMYAKFNDLEPYHIERKNKIPIVRISSFADQHYPYMKRFMELGNELKNEKRIILNLFYNGGGSSVFPQGFIKNLNGQSEWEISWAILTSPAITQYFAKYDLNAMPDISPGFRHTIMTNRKKHSEYRTTPMKNWEFGKTHNQKRYGSYNGTLIILTNRRVLSAAEAMIGYSKSVKNSILIGENTAGVAQFSDVQQYYLPNSKLIAKLPRQFLSIPDFDECIGFLPDYWLDSMEPTKEVLRWLNNPNNYQFKFSYSYNDMLEKNNLAPLIPSDMMIIAPSFRVPSALRAFSGKWFGISDGILDHILVVEIINDNMEVSAIYSWGVAYQWNINQPGWQRYNGKFQNQKMILTDEKNKIKITYMFNSDSTLYETYERPGVFTLTTLTRIDKQEQKCKDVSMK